MAYISLYRKYRPQNFDEIVGQQVVVTILQNSIKYNKVGHAYIFSGPRGVGKTSLAKIFARAVNCKNLKDGKSCNECDVCLDKNDTNIDIIEIDAASNNGVDEIREIRNNTKLMPSCLKYKIYIIDEVHMLSTSAFNALLKTLEEPPSHVIFILATTEIGKIPQTVVSRCQSFDFKKLTNKEIETKLYEILKKEKRSINENIIKLIAIKSNGGMRDAINLLDQILNYSTDKIEIKDFYTITGDIASDVIYRLVDEIYNKNLSETLKMVGDLYDNGTNMYVLCDHLLTIFKNILIFNNTRNYFDEEYENILNKYSKLDDKTIVYISEILLKLSNDLKNNCNHETLFAIAIVQVLSIVSKETNTNSVETEKKEEHKVNYNVSEVTNYNEIKKIRINNAFCGASKEIKTEINNKLTNLDEFLSSKEYNSVANLLKKSSLQVASKTNLIFTCRNSFEIVLFDKNIKDIEKLLKKITNNNIKAVAIDDELWNNLKQEYISNIKNGVEYKYMSEDVKTLKKSSNKLENKLNELFGDKYVTID